MSMTLAVVDTVEVPSTQPSRRRTVLLAQRRFGNATLLQWIVRRISDAQHVDQVVVLASEEEAEGLNRTLPSDATVIATSCSDALARLNGAVEEFGAFAAVRVQLSSPLVDPGLIDRLTITAKHHIGLDYVGFCSRGGVPAIRLHLGLFAEWIRAGAISTASRLAVERHDRDEPTRFVLSHPELFQMRFMPIPEAIDRPDFRLAVDSEDDWEHLHAIYEELGPERLDWQRIAGLLDHQPDLRKQMAALNSAIDAV